jgi:phosphoserine phosphatase
LQQWLAGRDSTLDGAWFYSDSHNDLPLLELVDNPVAVDPDETLLARARALGWPVISLRD